MADQSFDQEYATAVRAATRADAIEPRATSARFDRRSRRIVVELRNGATFIFPTELAEGLAGATASALSEVVVTPSGSGLRWPRLDADFSLPSLMMGVFGSPKWMRELARENGNTGSSSKAVSALSKSKRA
jgi:hypothetical protein